VSGVVLADQIESLDWRARQAELAGRVTEAAVREVLQKLGTLLDP
jgi:mRNA interferase MazF